MCKIDIEALFQKLENESTTNLPPDVANALDVVVAYSDDKKGVLAVLLTGYIYKYYYPEQDVRRHQTKIAGGYSGRSFDTRYVTPFLKRNKFPAMSESGWLTRSLEQYSPYGKEYPGAISGEGLKEAFALLYDYTDNLPPENVRAVLAYLYRKMVEKRDSAQITLSVPANKTIESTVSLVSQHHKNNASIANTSRLPHLAMYAIYECLFEANISRYQGKTLCPIQSHTAADVASNSIGDIQINDDQGLPFEGVEVKDRPISAEMLDTVYQKIQSNSQITRYYLLSTRGVLPKDKDRLHSQVTEVRTQHGCDVIINGVYKTLRYYLRLTSSQEFLKKYVDLVSNDESLQYKHRSSWEELCKL